MILHFGLPFEVWTGAEWRTQPGCFLTGGVPGPLRLRPVGRSRVLGVRFRPDGVGWWAGTAEVEGGAALAGPLGRELERAWDLTEPGEQVASGGAGAGGVVAAAG